MFVEVHFPQPLPVDRDDIEEAFEEALGDDGEVVGAGAGQYGSNLDVEFDSSIERDQALSVLATTIDNFRLDINARFHVEGEESWVGISEVLHRE